MLLVPPTVHESVSGALRTFYVKASPPLTAAVVFRVGEWDETVLNHGITHFVEHLALHPLRNTRHAFNGVVDGLTLTFLVAGREEQIAGFLSRLAGSLRALPLDRLDTEAGVLHAERALQPHLNLQRLLRVHFGPNGPGISGQGELGFDLAGPKEIQAWADRHCVLRNAVLLVAGPEPRDFRVDLPDGEPCPFVLPGPDVGHLPEGLEAVIRQDQGICFGAMVERSAAVVLALEVLVQRLTERLRHERGLIHAIAADYMPLDATTAFLYAGVDAIRERLRLVASEFLAVLRGLHDGPEQHELDALREEPYALGRLTESELAWSELRRVAAARLFGHPAVSWQDLAAERAAATREKVAEVSRAVLSRAAVIAPDIGGLGLRAFVLQDDPPLPGRVFRPRGRQPEGGLERIRIGPEGLSVFESHRCIVLRWSDIVLAARPTRTQWHLDYRTGASVTLDASSFWWRRTVARLLEEHVPREVQLSEFKRRE